MKRTFKFLPLILCAVMCLAVFLSACGDNTTTPPAHEHTFATTWTTSATEHWHAATCEHTDQTKDKAEHDFEGDKCKVCNYIKPHEHTFATTWTTDGTHHWHAATCEHTDQIKDKAAHNFDGGETCIICDYTKPHEHTFATTWTTDGTHHWHAATCEHTNETKDKAAHDFNGNKCTVCDYKKPLTWDDISNEQILNLFNEKIAMEAAKKCMGSFITVKEENVKNTTWYVSKNDTTLTKASLVFTYTDLNGSDTIVLCEIDFNSLLTPQNVQDKEIGTVTYNKLYSKSYASDEYQNYQTTRKPLTNAICDTLFGAKTGANRYIIDNGNDALDPTLGNSTAFTVIEITDMEIREKSIKIKYASTDEGYIENLQDETNYYTYGDDKNIAITGEKL